MFGKIIKFILLSFGLVSADKSIYLRNNKPIDQYKDTHSVIRNSKPSDFYKDTPPLIRKSKPIDQYKDTHFVIRNSKPTDFYKDTPSNNKSNYTSQIKITSIRRNRIDNTYEVNHSFDL